MKKIYAWSLVVSLTVSIFASFLFQKFAQAQAEMHSFPSVVPFGLDSGRVGFFDRGTGKLYIYTNNLDECVYTGQMTELGKPLKTDKPEKKSGTLQYDRFNNDRFKYKNPNGNTY